MTHLTAVSMPADPGRIAQDMAAAEAAGATMLEIRLDYLADPSVPLPTGGGGLGWGGGARRLPIIVTLRPEWEGGRFRGDENDRRKTLLRWADALGAEWIDVEYNAVRRGIWPEWESIRKRVILSFHDFEKTPDDLPRVAAAMAGFEPAKIKIACTADDVRDSLKVLRLLVDRPAGYAASDMIALAMGEAGIMTRVLAGKFGAFLTFATLPDGAKSAPGQVSLADMLGLYRFPKVGPPTEVYGVVGWPVGHSMSPAIHNAGFAELGLDKVYVLLPVRPGYENLAAALDGLRDFQPLHFRGASVTIPHKEDALRWAEKRSATDAVAQRAGALNTLRFEGDLVATRNSDVSAISRLSKPFIRAGIDETTGIVLGAGGAARAAIAAFQGLVWRDRNVLRAVRGEELGRVYVTNRTLSKSVQLANEFDETAIWWEHRAEKAAACPPDLIINCTSVGMTPNVDETPFPAHALSPKTVVFDTVYNPPETRLLREAKAAGCRTISGVDMFIEQAVAQFELWTGQSAPREVMGNIVRKRLGAKP